MQRSRFRQDDIFGLSFRGKYKNFQNSSLMPNYWNNYITSPTASPSAPFLLVNSWKLSHLIIMCSQSVALRPLTMFANMVTSPRHHKTHRPDLGRCSRVAPIRYLASYSTLSLRISRICLGELGDTPSLALFSSPVHLPQGACCPCKLQILPCRSASKYATGNGHLHWTGHGRCPYDGGVVGDRVHRLSCRLLT